MTHGNTRRALVTVASIAHAKVGVIDPTIGLIGLVGRTNQECVSQCTIAHNLDPLTTVALEPKGE